MKFGDKPPLVLTGEMLNHVGDDDGDVVLWFEEHDGRTDNTTVRLSRYYALHVAIMIMKTISGQDFE